MGREWDAAAETLRASLLREYPKLSSILDSPQGVPSFELSLHDYQIETPTSFEYDRVTQRPALFDFQQDLVQQILRLHHSYALLALPTGAGKTRTGASAVLEGIASGRFQRVLWLAPSIELVEQAFSTFADLCVFQGNLTSILLTREPVLEKGRPLILLTTPQTIYARRNDRRYLQSWDIIVFDEAHQLGAPTFRAAVEAVTRGPDRRMQSVSLPILLGLSATPGRVDYSETEDLVALFEGNLLKSARLGSDPVGTLQREGVLANLTFKSLTKARVSAEQEARRLMIAANACAELVRRGRRPLVFAATVPSAIVLADVLRGSSVRAEALHSETPAPYRRAVLGAFETGKIDVLVNQRLLATGYDCPAISDVLILGRIGSPVLFEQVVGRAARGPKTGGSRTASIWDFDDHLQIHGRPSSYYRYKDFDWS